MKRTVGQALLGLAVALAMLGTAQTAAAQIHLNPAYGDGTLLGPTAARGAVVWSMAGRWMRRIPAPPPPSS